MLLGTDISYYQTNLNSVNHVDFSKMMNAGSNFTFIRACYGSSVDSRFVENWKNSKESGIFRGAYHYALLSVNYNKQVDTLINLLSSDSGELPVALDLEKYANQSFLERNLLLNFVQKFKNDIKSKLNKEIVLYTNPDMMTNYLSPIPQWLLDTDLWIANYVVNSPSIGSWKTWKFWQYTNKGIGKDYGCESASVDLNYFNGDYEDLLKYIGKEDNAEEPSNLTIEERLTNLEKWAITKGYEQ